MPNVAPRFPLPPDFSPPTTPPLSNILVSVGSCSDSVGYETVDPFNIHKYNNRRRTRSFGGSMDVFDSRNSNYYSNPNADMSQRSQPSTEITS